jgi:hypothetical protein
MEPTEEVEEEGLPGRWTRARRSQQGSAGDGRGSGERMEALSVGGVVSLGGWRLRLGL